MNYHNRLRQLPGEIKCFIGAFILVLSIGFYTGLLFVNETGGTEPVGLEENYLGNESDPNAGLLKFKKSEREMLTIIHTHTLSMSMIFFLLGSILWFTSLSKRLKLFLSLEPFVSVLLTFGGIYFLWSGMLWTKYIVLFSGILMTLTFVVSTAIILFELVVPGSISGKTE